MILILFFYIQRFWQFEDLGHNEDEQIINSINNTVSERFLIAGSKKFAKANEKRIKKTVVEFVKSDGGYLNIKGGLVAGISPEKVDEFWERLK